MRVQRQYTISVPIPSFVPPSLVIGHLQTIDPVIRHLGTFSRYEPAQHRLPDIRDDPFFLPNGPEISAFQIYELITLAPGLTKEVTYPAFFQPSHTGVRCRANGTAGITGWADYNVQQSQQRASSASASPPDGSSAAMSTPSPGAIAEAWEYEIHETLLVEANSLLMPFVARTMEESHRDLLRKIIDEAAASYALARDGTSTATTTPQDKMQE